MRNLFIIMCIALFTAGCGDDDSKPVSTKAPSTSDKAETAATQPSASKAASSSDGVYKMVDGIRIVDHSRDEKEFELRRSIGGVESMIKSFKEQGLDTVQLESQLKELKQKLDALLSG